MKRLLFAPLVFLAACNSPGPKASTASLREAAIDPSALGVIRGRVTFSGTPPKPRRLDLSANPTCERQHTKPVLSEEVVTGAGGGLRNVLVWLKQGVPAVRWKVPQESVKLDQQGCIYTPHVFALMVGQPLEVSNSDPLNHNVHAESGVNAPFNVAQPPRAE